MIYFDGDRLDPNHKYELDDLLRHPVLVSASDSLKSLPEQKISNNRDSVSNGSKMGKCVYIFQREHATVDPALVDLVGTDEATTCVGVVIRNSRTGIISIAHMDSPDIVKRGLSQMLDLVADHQNPKALLDVHLMGGFEDVPYEHFSRDTENQEKPQGYSYPLCSKIIDTLRLSREMFQIRTLHVLNHNTKWDSEGIPHPMFHGFVVDTSNGSIIPASFDHTSRCPDEVVRRIRVTSAYEDPKWNGRLLDTYDTNTDSFVIAPCTWTMRQKRIALILQELSDSAILRTCSTSPSAEGPDFVSTERRKWDYLIQHPECEETFPLKQAREFQRTEDGDWVKIQPSLSN